MSFPYRKEVFTGPPSLSALEWRTLMLANDGYYQLQSQAMVNFRRNGLLCNTRTYKDDRRVHHNFAVRCKHCYDFCWPRYECHRIITNTYEYYCETCWLWWQRTVSDFRLKTLAKTLPSWMLSTDDQRYNLLLGGDIRLKALRKRKRQRYLYLLLSTSGHLKELQDMMSPNPSAVGS